MLPALIIIGLVAAAGLTAAVSGPATARTRDMDSTRRARYLSRNPQDVNSGDISRMLTEAGLDLDEVAHTRNGATELGYTPFTMYAWIKKYDARTLSAVIAERISESEALAHISDDTLPLIESICEFAETHHVSMLVRADRDERRRRSIPRGVNLSTTRTPSESIPAVFAPGDWTQESGRTTVLADEPTALELLDMMIALNYTPEARHDGQQAA